MVRYVIPVLATLALCGCGTSPSTKQEEDPVESFRRHVAAGTRHASSKGWSLQERGTDVRKTDSLTSPYESTLTVHVSGEPDRSGPQDLNMKIVFSYTQGRWTVKNAEYQSLRYNDPRWRPVFDDRDNLPGSSYRLLADCFK